MTKLRRTGGKIATISYSRSNQNPKPRSRIWTKCRKDSNRPKRKLKSISKIKKYSKNPKCPAKYLLKKPNAEYRGQPQKLSCYLIL